MHRISGPIAFLFAASLTMVGFADEFRFWTTADGKRSGTRLQYLQHNQTHVQLLREDNQNKVAMRLSNLSAKDRAWVMRQSDDAVADDDDDGRDMDDMVEQNVSSTTSPQWPQWRGPIRNGVSPETGLLQQWPAEGPPIAWQVQGMGEGYSTPSVANDRVYLMGAFGDQERLLCMSLGDGSQLWATPIGSKAPGGGYKGPRGSATVDGELVLILGSDGTLACMNNEDGSVRWKKNLKRDFGGRVGSWDYAESPLVDGDRVICTPGGTQATMVGLNKNTGQPVWRGSAAQLGDGYATAGYSSTIVANVHGVRQYVNFLSGGVVAFDANSGAGLWHYDAPANGTANCSTPIISGTAVFAASGYGTGGGKAEIVRRGNAFDVRESYFVNSFQNHHGGFVLLDGFIYGANDSVLMCIDWNSGKMMWRDRCVGKGSIAAADGQLYVRGERGDLALVSATPEGYQLTGRFKQPNRSGQNAWPHPVIAG
ncbi:MAG: PQQ-binding-like beta-propeller repeat protein, partial [Planctomycetota bacterium]